MEVNVIIVILALGAGLWDVETDAVTVTGEEGRDIEIKCSHSNTFTNPKYFCKGACRNEDVLVHTWEKPSNEKYRIRDEGNTFYVTISDLTTDDTGVYWCGFDRIGVDTFTRVDLTVRKRTITQENPLGSNTSPSRKLLYIWPSLGVVVLGLVIVLIIFIIHRNRDKDRDRDCWKNLNLNMSTDHVTVMAGVRPEPEHHYRCSSLDQTDLSGFPPPPPDLCFHFTSKQRESTVTVGVGEYVNVDVSERICQYQHLDLSRLQDHVYQSLHGNCGPKDRARVKE